MPDSELDQLLGLWLSEGAEVAPDRIAEAAIRDVTTVAQERDWLAAISGSFSSAPLAWAAAVLALSVGVGVFIGPSLVTVEPSPTPTPQPSPRTREFREAGFQMDIPTGWSVLSETVGVVEMFGGGSTFTVRVGDSDGHIKTCDSPGRPWERCRDAVITTLEEFADAVKQGPVEGCSGLCAPSAGGRAATLGGEEAWRVKIYGYEYPAQGGENALYVLALHNGQPYFLRFHTSLNFAPGSPPGSLWDEMVASFRFLDDPASSDSAGEWQTFAIADAGLELDVPGEWQLWPLSDVGREIRLTGPGGGIGIRVSDADGRLLACGPTALCRWTPVATIDDLVHIAATEYRLQNQFGGGALEIERWPITLDGVEAWFVTVRPPSGMLAPQPEWYAVALHGGKALLFSWYNYDDSRGVFGDIIRSVRFIENQTDQPVSQIVTGLGFEIMVPAAWSVITHSPGQIEIVGPSQRMAIQVGDEAGRLSDRCQYRSSSIAPANRYWEGCEDVVITTVDGFARLFINGSIVAPRLERPDSLAGEEARRTRINGYDYVFALYEGRPYVISHRITGPFQPSAPPPPAFIELLDTFAFVDTGDT